MNDKQYNTTRPESQLKNSSCIRISLLEGVMCPHPYIYASTIPQLASSSLEVVVKLWRCDESVLMLVHCELCWLQAVGSPYRYRPRH